MKNQKIIGWACFLLIGLLFTISVSYPTERAEKVTKVDTCVKDTVRDTLLIYQE
jgi:hypothetical protein